MTTSHSEPFYFLILLGIVTSVWGYFFWRGLKYGEYRRIGLWGWLRKQDELITYWSYMLNYGVEFGCCLLVLCILIWRQFI